MHEIVYRRQFGALPFIIKKDDLLFLCFGAGADANHEPRTFTVPISEEHSTVIQTDFTRHLLLWSALLPLGDAAGTADPINESAAVALLDPILLGSEAEAERLLKQIPWYEAQLITHHADPAQLALGNVFAATTSLTETADITLSQEYAASRKHLFIAPLDEAILRYTNQYLHGGGLPSRNPDAVDPALLPKVLEIISTAEKSCTGMELPIDYGTDYAHSHQRDKEEWNKIKDRVEQSLQNAFPTLSSKVVESVSFLMCSEAASRAKRVRNNSL